MSHKNIRILLADDHEDVLRETEKFLASDFDVVGTASDGASLIAAVLDLKPDVVVTDFIMPGMNGIDCGREILHRRLCGTIVLLTMYNDSELAKTALATGIRAYVLKTNAGEQLIPAIRTALQGMTFVSPAVSAPIGL
jgi:DNA-binding NarL/FixJ family response regulator